jgi:Cu2+-containing amine oxidase
MISGEDTSLIFMSTITAPEAAKAISTEGFINNVNRYDIITDTKGASRRLNEKKVRFLNICHPMKEAKDTKTNSTII